MYKPLFDFLIYLNPTWYFNIYTSNKIPYFPEYNLLDTDQKKCINFDIHYSSQEISKLDAAYQAWNCGIIETDYSKILDYSEIQPSVYDNYRFLRKYYHPIWSWYVLIIRLMTLNNPLREILGFLKSQNVKRKKILINIFSYEVEYNKYNYKFLKDKPKVSIIIPTLNRYKYLTDVLKDLEQQDYKNFDVIIVDQSEPFMEDFYKKFALDIKLIRQEEKALWLARNTAIKCSDAPYILLFDDDSRVESDWITNHLKCLEFFNADISSGVSLSVIGAKIPENYSFFRWSDQLDTGNVMIKREVFEKIGLFDRQFEKQRMGDGEFGLRAYLAGFKNISNPYAKRIHLKVGEGGLRQMGHWDAFRPKKFFAARPIPSVLYLKRKYFGRKVSLFFLLSTVPPSIVPYKWKSKNFILIIGSVLSVIVFPIIILQVFKSWKLSSKMLNKGALIEFI